MQGEGVYAAIKPAAKYPTYVIVFCTHKAIDTDIDSARIRHQGARVPSAHVEKADIQHKERSKESQ